MTNTPNPIERIITAVDIVKLIEETTPLTANENRYTGICPFHADKASSLQVCPKKQIFKCFVCGAGGDVLSWAMRINNTSFKTTIQALSRRTGIDLPPS